MSAGEGVLTALNTYQQFSNQRIRNEQAKQALQIEREKQDVLNFEQAEREKKVRATDVVGDINGHFGYSTAADYRSQPWERLNAEDPELAARLANARPEYVTFVNEKGENVQGAYHSFEKRVNEEGETVYVPMVRRFDTNEVHPQTVGRTANPDDPVVQLSAAEFKKKMDKAWRTQIKNGGLENTMSYLTTREASLAKYEEQELERQILEMEATNSVLDVVGFDSKITPESKTAFLDLVMGIDDPEELLKIAEKQGLDTDLIRDKARKKAQEEIMATAPDGSLEQALYENGITREIWENSSESKKKLILERLNSKRNFQGAVSSMLGLPADIIQDAVTYPWDTLVNLGNSIAESGVGRFFGMSEITDDPTPPRIMAENITEGRERRERLADRRTMDDINAVFSGDNFTGELTTKNISDAILSGQEASQETVNTVNAILNKNGIQTTDQLRQAIKDKLVGEREAKMVAFVAGATHSGSAAEKDAVAKQMMNLIERGDMDMSKKDQMAAETAAVEARTAYETLVFERDKYDGTEMEAATNASAALLESISAAYGMGRYEGEGEERRFVFNGKDFKPGNEKKQQRVARELTRYVAKYPGRQKGPRSLEAYMNGLRAATGLYLQGLAAQDESPFFSMDNFADFFRVEPSGQIDFDLRNVRFSEVKDGVPTRVNYIGPDGAVSSSISLKDIETGSPVLARIVRTAAKTNQDMSR